MSREELKHDQMITFDAIYRRVESGQTETGAFKKLVARLAWVNAELAKNGWTD